MDKTNSNDIFKFFQFRNIGGMVPSAQIVVITLLYVVMTLCYYVQVHRTGRMDGYPPSVSMLFVPIYEETIFRGILLRFFEKHYGFILSIVYVSILFGLWHLKNILWMNPDSIARQIAYTCLFFSPVMCWVTLKAESVWPAVILHYLNNLSALIFVRHLQ